MISAVMIDNREPDWVKALRFSGAPVTTTLLEFGDAHVVTDDGVLLVVERKTTDDFLNTLRDERLFIQLAGLKTVSDWAYLLITGVLLRGPAGRVISDRRETGWDWKSVQGALLTVQEMGVFVSYCGGDADYEAAIIRLSQRKRDPIMRLKPKREAHLVNGQVAFLAGLPGVGLEKAQTLLDYCGSVAFALECLTNPEDKMPSGFGQRTRDDARWTLQLSDTQYLAVLSVNEPAREIAS